MRNCPEQGIPRLPDLDDKRQERAYEEDVIALSARITQAFNRGDVTACAEGYAEDAALFVASRPPVQGRDGIRAVLQEGANLGMQLGALEAHEMGASGEMANCGGTYEIRTPSADGAIKSKVGKFLTLFMRLDDGSWKAVADCSTYA
jgi:ketosteroid isomerase-like protein